MIFTKVYIDNLYCFSETEVDFTFDKKLPNSTIEHECLAGAPKFKYKKAVIITGQNASGKTAFGKVLCGIQNFLFRHEIVPDLYEGVYDKTRPVTLNIEFVTKESPSKDEKYKLHRLHFSFSKETFSSPKIRQIEYASTPIQRAETNTVARRRLNHIFEDKIATKNRNVDMHLTIDYEPLEIEKITIETIIKINLYRSDIDGRFTGWAYNFSESSSKYDHSVDVNLLSAQALKKILCAFDKSIDHVESVSVANNEPDKQDGYRVSFKNGKQAYIMGENMEVSDRNRFSKGTLEGIAIASIYAEIKSKNKTIFYIDEKMAYCHSELEIAMLNLLIESLPRDSQLFYTTHNYDIIEMNLPPHSHYIFRKRGEFAEVVDIGRKFSKNDRSLLNYVRNDAFDTLPDTSEIDSLAWGE